MKRLRPLTLLALAAATSALVAVAAAAQAPPTTKPAAQAEDATKAPRRAIAVVRPTSGHDVRGVVTFEERPDGVQIETTMSGLPPGEHAYHVHVYGDCSSKDGKAAGPHYRFGPEDRGITGNLGELEGVGSTVTAVRLLPLAKLSGDRSIIGRSVVVHERGNDPSQPPDGAAGARLGCGVIGIDGGEESGRSAAGYGER